jgi:hypothetical protein
VIHPLSNHHDIVLNNLNILIINTSFDLYDEDFGTRGAFTTSTTLVKLPLPSVATITSKTIFFLSF